jgi:hypothetical protein
VIAEPALWLVGAAGFLFRGGWLVLAVPIWTLPSPVGVSTVLGPELLGIGGLSAALVATLVWMLAITGIVLAISAVGAAWVDLTMFEHYVREPETLELRGGVEPRTVTRRTREVLLVRLLVVYAAALIPVGVAVFVAAVFLYDAAYQEFLLPGSLQVPLVLRVAGRALLPLLVVVLCVLMAEAATSSVSRWVLASGFGLARGPAGADDARSRGAVPGVDSMSRLTRVLFVAAGAWLITIALVAPGVASTLLGWTALRAVYSGPEGLERIESAIQAGGVTLVFMVLWAAALVLGGFASALRAALWNGWWLSEFGHRDVTSEPAPASR